MSQRESIVKRLKRGWTTGIDALNDCGTMKLASRVSELRDQGYNVLDKWVQQGGKRFKAYRIA